MRVYKFLSSEFALKDIREHRIKISEIHDLNDPFELIPFDLSDPDFRRGIIKSRDEMNRRGVLSFSSKWNNPLLWSHYADKHKGICLGFDVVAADENTIYVEYANERLPPPLKLDASFALNLLRTKFAGWEYEGEVRIFATRDTEENGYYYANFDGNGLVLREVIVGHRCCVERGQIIGLTTSYPAQEQIEIMKARLSFTTFMVIENPDSFS